MTDERHDPRYDADLRERVRSILRAKPDTSVRQMAKQIDRSTTRAHALMVEVRDENRAA
jgi:hypothetical protein